MSQTRGISTPQPAWSTVREASIARRKYGFRIAGISITSTGRPIGLLERLEEAEVAIGAPARCGIELDQEVEVARLSVEAVAGRGPE